MARHIETVLLSLMLVASAGCSSRSGESTTGGSQSSPDSGATASATAKSGEQQHPATPASKSTEAHPNAQSKAEPVAQAGHVRLLQKACVQFEPQWISIGVGKSLTWDSELKAPVTIHVTAGAFSKTEFVVRPGASVNSGPARAAGDYAIWTEPAACQGAPRGARGSGPGVTVEASGH
jgi:plastocyanin